MDALRANASAVTIALALCVVAVAAVVPVLVDARPATEIPVSDLSGEGDSLAEPDGDAWNDTPPATVSLASAPSQAPAADDTTVEEVSVRAAYTGERLYVRLRWADGTIDDDLDPTETRTPHGGTFADAAAVQLPANESADPGIAMGSDREQVNVWYWEATQGGQEIVAGGPSTTTQLQQPAVETAASGEDGEWTVVFARDLVVDGGSGDRLAVEMEEDLNLAVGVWNGSNQERAGKKAVSEWQYLPLGPGAQGPPYEAILWAVAGLAIVVVIVATWAGVSGGGAES